MTNLAGVAIPRRRERPPALVVVAELVGALALGGVAWWCWQRGVVVTVRRGVPMSRIIGGWWASATVAATLAGLLLLDAGRRVRAQMSRQRR